MPRSLPGVDTLEFQIIDDGSTDSTVEVARKLGVHHIVRVKGRNRRWLGRAFRLGIDNALRQGADIVVNTDGDNQYPASFISELIQPLLDGKVDIAIGDRNPGSVAEFSPIKRFLQRLGCNVIAFLTGEEVRDAVSGFRAYTREALQQIHITTNYTYTVDTLIQANKKGLDIAWVPITTNPKTRESRLIKSLFDKVRLSGMTILRVSTVYAPFKTFALLSLLFFVPAASYVTRFLYVYFFCASGGAGHIQSLIIAGAFLVISVQLLLFGILGELLSTNRLLIEDTLRRVRELEFERSAPVQHYYQDSTRIRVHE